MRPGRATGTAAFLAAVLSALPIASLGLAGAVAAANLRVRDNQLVDGPGRGQPVQLRGVNRSGPEYACIQGWGFFDSPHPNAIDTAAMIAAMRSWDIDVVRLPLNEDCWLGVNTPAGRGGTPYRRIVMAYVHALHAAHLYVILDLHLTAPGSTPARAVADRHRIGYLGWAWDATSPGGWNCSTGPALITSYNGSPTAYGIGLRDHLRGLGPAPPALP